MGVCVYSIYSFKSRMCINHTTLYKYIGIKCIYVHVFVLYSIYVFILYVVFPTGIRESLDSTMPNEEATSCSVNVRGEEKCCKLGIIQEHRARKDTSTENPCKNRE